MEPLVIDFMMQRKKKFSKGTLWSIYSCLNHNFQVKKRTNLKNFSRLKVIMRRLTQGHVPCKSPVLSEEEVNEIFQKFDYNDPNQLVAKVGIALMFYGLLRQEEVIMLQVQDVVVCEDGEVIVKFPYATKTKEDGFK